MLFNLKKPCGNCPFRVDVPPYLTPHRTAEISDCVVRHDQTFACHKTTGVAGGAVQEHQMCAGALILHLKEGMPDWRLRFAEQLGLWCRTKMRGTELVYATARAMQAANPLQQAGQRAICRAAPEHAERTDEPY